MHGQERRAEPGDAFDALGDRVADVVQLEIQNTCLPALASTRAKSMPPAKAS